jgi:hypothetical protein
MIHLITRLEGANVMAQVIEFHIPADFRPKIECVPQEERGRLVVIPRNLKSRREIGQFSVREKTQQMSTQSMVRVITGDPSAIGSVYADRSGLHRHGNTTDSSSREVLVENSV